MHKLIAINGLSILRRYHEINKDMEAPQRADQSVASTLASFRRLLSTQAPSHVLAAFDAGPPNWRHAIYPGYRENRIPTPIELKERLPELFQQLRDLGLHPLSIESVESEDVIATGVLRWLAEDKGEAIVIARERKLHALIAHGALLWDHFEQAVHDAKWVEGKWGVTPAQLPDFLALAGYKPDSVPGVAGIGMKKASALLQSYKTLDGVMSGAALLLNPLGATLRKEKEMAYLSRQLVTLKTDVTLGVTWRTLAIP